MVIAVDNNLLIISFVNKHKRSNDPLNSDNYRDEQEIDPCGAESERRLESQTERLIESIEPFRHQTASYRQGAGVERSPAYGAGHSQQRW